MPPDDAAGTAWTTALSRRSFIERAGLLGAAVALSQLPALLAPRELVAEATALELDAVRDTFNGLMAFVLPGDDGYSTAQGESASGPGGVASGGTDFLIALGDRLVPASVAGQPSVNVPLSAALAALLNSFALQVNPAAAEGAFLSPFARLSFRDKAEAIRLLDAEAVISQIVEPVRYVSALLISAIAFAAVSEAGVYDASARRLRRRPIGWELSRYAGPAEGHRAFKGYYRGYRSAVTRRRKRRRRLGRGRT